MTRLVLQVGFLMSCLLLLSSCSPSDWGIPVPVATFKEMEDLKKDVENIKRTYATKHEMDSRLEGVDSRMKEVLSAYRQRQRTEAGLDPAFYSAGLPPSNLLSSLGPLELGTPIGAPLNTELLARSPAFEQNQGISLNQAYTRLSNQLWGEMQIMHRGQLTDHDLQVKLIMKLQQMADRIGLPLLEAQPLKTPWRSGVVYSFARPGRPPLRYWYCDGRYIYTWDR